jgi:hypothetical protein
MVPAIFAPLIAGGLDLVTNAAMALGTKWIEDKTGIDISKGKLSSDDMLALQQYQMDHELELRKIQQQDDQLGVAREALYLADTQSSRNMQVAALQQDDKFSKRFIYYFSIFWSICSVTYIYFITFSVIPADNVRFADTILGFLLGTLVSSMFSYFYGTTIGSQNKSKTIDAVIEKAMK